MTKKEATVVAQALFGDPIELPQGEWGVRLASDLNRFVVIDDEYICQYDTEENFQESNPVWTFAIY